MTVTQTIYLSIVPTDKDFLNLENLEDWQIGNAKNPVFRTDPDLILRIKQYFDEKENDIDSWNFSRTEFGHWDSTTPTINQKGIPFEEILNAMKRFSQAFPEKQYIFWVLVEDNQIISQTYVRNGDIIKQKVIEFPDHCVVDIQPKWNITNLINSN